MPEKTSKPAETPAKVARSSTVVATCKCGASKEATAATKELATSTAVTYTIHKDGCDVDNSRWQGWFKVEDK
jgi:hypothetical protein